MSSPKTCTIDGVTYQVGDRLEPGMFPVVEDIYRIDQPAPTRWFVVQTNPNCERKAEGGLIEVGADAYLPRLRKWRPIPKRQRGHKGASREAAVRPLFPGYVFLGWSRAGEPPWLTLRRVEGIRAILRPWDFQKFTMVVLGLRGDEMAGHFDGCQVKSRRGRRKQMSSVPQFVTAGDADRVSALIRMMRGPVIAEGSKSC